MKIEVKTVECTRCSYVHIPSILRGVAQPPPKKCPECDSYFWQTAPTKHKPGREPGRKNKPAE